MAANPLILLLAGLLPVVVMVLLFWPGINLIRKWRCRRRSLKILVEDALKLIITNEMEHPQTGVDDLAHALDCRAEKFREVLQFMERNDLAQVEGDVLQLTVAGRDYATFLLRAHRLYERYLADRTGFSEDEWHERAEWIEHSLTSEDLHNIAADLHFPNRDPHGDPIPSPDGRVFTTAWLPLEEAPEGVPLVVEHIEDEPRSDYTAIRKLGLYPGGFLMVRGHGDEVVAVELDDRCIELSKNLAPLVSVRVTEEGLPAAVESGVPLSSLDPGGKAVILELQPQLRGVERRRLMDFGMLPETEIQAELRSPSGDPTAYRIRSSLIALREDQARYIRVRPVEGRKQDG